MNEIELIKRDICARLPFGVYCEMGNGKSKIEEVLHSGGLDMLLDGRWMVKPYLFRMEDITRAVDLYGERKVMMDRILDVMDLDGYCGLYTSWEEDQADKAFITVKTWGEPKCLLSLDGLTVYDYHSSRPVPVPWTYYIGIYNLLIGSHFDVNGLIQKNLAHAVTRRKNPYAERRPGDV